MTAVGKGGKDLEIWGRFWYLCGEKTAKKLQRFSTTHHIMKTKFYLDKRGKDASAPLLLPEETKATPLYPIKIMINSHGRSAFIGTGISVAESQWLSKPSPGQIVFHTKKERLNLILSEKKLTVDKILEDLRTKGALHGKSASEIRGLVVAKLSEIEEGAVGGELPVVKCFERFIRTKKRRGTAGVYESTKRRLLAWDGFSEGTTFREVTASWLENFNSFLAETAPSANARGIHLRNLRAVFNYALGEELTGAPYPFKRWKIRTAPTKDRSLTPEELRAIRDADCSKTLARYRDYFLLSFFLCGLNLEDILCIKEIKGGRIEVLRSKTGQPVSIRVEPEAQEIIERYKGEKHLLDAMDRCGNYKNFQSRINKYLKLIGKRYNPVTKKWDGEAVREDLSFYYARYAWATIAAELDTPERTIGAALAHSTAKTVTSIYTRVDMRKKVDAANRAVIDHCFSKNLENKK